INLGPARSVFLGESRHILGLAWPMIGAQLLWLSMVFVDNVMVGRLGSEPLAAMAMASTLFSLTYVFSMGVLSALGAIIAHEFGAGKVDSIAPTVRQGFRVAAAMAGITILIFSQADTLLRWLGQKPEL